LAGGVGSAWIKENILGNKAYYGRRSMDVVVPELPICECVKFWRDRVGRTAMREIIDVLSVTGGVPRYLEEINPSQTADENLRRMAFCPDSILRQFDGWNALAGLAFEALVVGHYRELLTLLHMGESLVYSAAPYRKAGRRKGEGLQVDLLLQTRRSLCVVEVKRRRTIGAGIVDEVAQKVSRLKRPADCTVRTALVYDGCLAPTILADGYFDAVVSFAALAGVEWLRS